jgi:transcriptional regulator with PAS, ATPase and Fis domain
VGKKEGLIEAANGGTVFLDEIRELHPVMQAKLLTLLDTRRFRRVGSVRATSVDVRFIAATNRILLAEVNAGKFRDDLYYRLQVIAINIPALRERGDDVFILAESFLAKYNALHGSRMKRLDAEVEPIFRAYAWPGNVRELENLLERICILEDGDRVRVEHLPDRILRGARGRTAATPPSGAGADYAQATERFQRGLIEQALAAAGGNVAQAATALGLSRHALRHQMIRLGMAGGAGRA